MDRSCSTSSAAWSGRSTRSPRTRLSLDRLEEREVPAVIYNVNTTADTDDANLGTQVLSAVKITGSTADYGGAISNAGQLRVARSWIEGNTARGGPGGRGGGIAGQGKSTALVTGTQILSNTADSRGGGVAVLDTARVELQDTGVIGNSANYGGGAYNSGGTFVMGGGTIGSNAASMNGGGLEHAGGTTALTGVTIQDNTAGNTGGGIIIGSGAVFMTGGTLQDNSAILGGGVHQKGGSATFQGVTIQNNVASLWGGAVWIEAGSISFTACTFAGNDALIAPLIARQAKNQPTVTVAADCQGINPNTDIVDV